MTRLPSAANARTVHAALLERGATIATAESLTGGLVAATLTVTPGASRTFRGGLVVYATALKHSLAGVPTDLLETEGPVSRLTAEAMARGVRERLGSQWGLALTGVAGPEPQDEQPVGTVHLALAGPQGQLEVRSLVLDGDRGSIRDAAVEASLSLVADALSSDD